MSDNCGREHYNGTGKRKTDNSKLELVTDHVWTRLITRAAIVALAVMGPFVANRVLDQIEANTRTARALSDSQIVLVQQQKQLVNTFTEFRETLEDVEADVEDVRGRVTRLEARDELR